MAKKEYETICKQVAGFEAEVSKCSESLEEAKTRIENAQGDLDRLWEDYKAGVMGGNSVDITRIEGAIEDRKKQLSRDRALVAGLEEELPKLQDRLQEATEKRNALFVEAARKWLKAETTAYDDHAARALASIRRLFIAFAKLRDIGQGEVAKEIIGEAFDYLPGIKLPLIKNFDRGQFQTGNRSALVRPTSAKERADTLAEIIS